MQNRKPVFGLCLMLAVGVGGCSTYLEATRPDPVDLDKFAPAEARLNVIGELGSPASSVKDQDKSCDVYQLYTHGPGAWGKAGIAFGEAAADVFTLGLAEVATTPAEAATRNKLHTVLFCYSADDKLAFVHESDSPSAQAAAVGSAQGGVPGVQASATQPSQSSH